MMAVRDRLARDHGTVFEVAGRELAVAPAPERLRAVEEAPGLPQEKVSRLHALADAALGGVVDVERLRLLGPAAAMRDLQILPGIGPFYSALIVIRACGFTDVLPSEEPRLRASVGRAYGLGRACTAEQLASVAEAWRPFRTWVSVLFRAATDRLAEQEEALPA
jgi:DNA-3-methyladenine glycosylase II